MDAIRSLDLYSPLGLGVLVCAGSTLVCWVGSLITGNCSQVDRLWSILPVAYSWVVYARSPTENPRVLIMALLATLWGFRLSFNFWRKGGYKAGEEDYRWPVLRKIINNKFLYELFNLVFISIYQNILIFLFSSPIIVASANSHKSLNIIDYIGVIAFLLFLAVETISDQQQWNFQQQKYALINANKKRTGAYLAGFYCDGLFKYSRHPNFFCENLIWWVFYAFSVAASGQTINWSIIGPILLTMLFQGSTQFTEYITSQKYPLYKVYQETTSRFTPWWPSNREKLLRAIENKTE